jgi:hypothetical protein
MRIPRIRGKIERRILANFAVDPEVMARQLPAPFRPIVHRGKAVGGICLIRLAGVRPRFVPAFAGYSSENAAHRIAVEWTDAAGQRCEGVYIPRRDTSSRLNTWLGGRLFPGVHHHARFAVRETPDELSVDMQSDDGAARVAVHGRVAASLPAGSVFGSLAEASRFLERGSLGYSNTVRDGEYDGLELKTFGWRVEPLEVTEIASSYFDDGARFPAGSVRFDCALVMRNVDHEWLGRASLVA